MTLPGKRVRFAFGWLPGDGEPTSWYDVTSSVRSIMIVAGRSQDLDRIEAATANIELDNQAGSFTPDNGTGTYYPYVRPFTPVEIAWIDDDTLTPFTLGVSTLGTDTTLYTTAPNTGKVFRGLVERWTPEWWKPNGGVCRVECVDLFRFLQLKSLSAEVFVQQTVGARISAVLTAIGSPFVSSIDTAGVTIKATTVTANALDYLKELAVLDGGVFRCRGDGVLEYKSRSTLLASSTYSTVQATIGDQAGEIPYMSLAISTDEQILINRVIARNSAGTSITAQEDAESQDFYLVREYDMGDTDIVSITETQTRAREELVSKSIARGRVDDLSFQLRDSSVDAETLLGLDVMYRVSIARRPDAGSSIIRDYLVQGFQHEIDASNWKLNLNVSMTPDAFELGVATLGVSAL